MCNIYISYEKRSHLATYFIYQGFPNSSVGKRICLQCRRPRFNSWIGKIHWRRNRLLTPIFLGFLCGSAGKESTCNMGDLGSIPGLGRSSGERQSYPLQYSGLENLMDCIVNGVTELDMTKQLSLHFTSYTLVCMCPCQFSNLSLPILPSNNQKFIFCICAI